MRKSHLGDAGKGHLSSPELNAEWEALATEGLVPMCGNLWAAVSEAELPGVLMDGWVG